MKNILVVSFVFLLQSCTILNIKQDNAGTSRSLVFTENKKWLINNLYSDLYSTDREKMNQKIFETFSTLSKGNAFTLESARKDNLLRSTFPFVPSEEDIEQLKNTTDFDFLVNIRTLVVKDQIALVETSRPLMYSKNEAFALLEVYDIKTGKKIYTQKASAMKSMEGQKEFPQLNNEGNWQNKDEDKGPFFSPSGSQISIKCLKKILRNIKSNAIQ